MLKITTVRFILLSVIVSVLSSCSTVGKALLYSEPSIQPVDVKIKTVAILPNRLPVSLQNPEAWRVKNHATMKEILEKKGYSVIDYNTSNQMFQQSGLPMEDTKSSRDKYAELAQKLNADLLIFPYYGVTFISSAVSDKYIATASLQFYSQKHNDFSARVDLEGVNKIQTWPQLIPMIGSFYPFFIIGAGNHGHEKAFKKAFEAGFEIYASRYISSNNSNNINNNYSGGNNSGNNYNNNSNPNNNNNQNNSNNNKSNSSESKYAKYSLGDLETLKKLAIEGNDYKTAGEIKAEMDKRKK